MRRWIPWLLVTAFLAIVVTRFGEVENLAQVLSEGAWGWVLAAGLLQLAYYGTYAATYQAAFDTVGVKARWRSLLSVTIASVFVNVAAPSGGTAGAALFVDDAARRGESAPRAAVGALLTLVADYAAFAPILLLGMTYLFSMHDLSLLEIISAALMMMLIIGLAGVLLIGLWRPELLQHLLAWLERSANRLARRLRQPAVLSPGWAHIYGEEFIAASTVIAARPQATVRTLLIALLAHGVNMLSLLTVALAFHQQLSLGALVSGYAMCILFLIISITPMGIGVVEAMMTLVFTSLGIPAHTAAVIALAYRGLSFWIPFGLGFVLFKRLPVFRSQRAGLPERPVSAAPGGPRPDPLPGDDLTG